MSIYRRKPHVIPGLNTASLPDLIFTVLFFFMIVTHMRKVTPKVKYSVPTGPELTRLTKKSAISYIYIGKPLHHESGESMIQVNDKYADLNDIKDYVIGERERMTPEDRQKMTISIKADKETRMGVVTDVKEALREVDARKINMSGNKPTKDS